MRLQAVVGYVLEELSDSFWHGVTFCCVLEDLIVIALERHPHIGDISSAAYRNKSHSS